MQQKLINVTQFIVNADFSAIAEIRPRFIDFLFSLGIPDTEKEGWKLVFTELLNNAIEHGCAQGSQPLIKIEWYQTRSQVFLCLHQPGEGPSDALLESPQLPEDPLAEGGRGLFIIRSFVDDWRWMRGKNSFELSVWKTYQHLNYTLPVNQEAEAILDELSDCYENLSLFHSMAEALKQGLSLEVLVEKTITLFVEAGGYDVAHLEILPTTVLPELISLAASQYCKALELDRGSLHPLFKHTNGVTWSSEDHPCPKVMHTETVTHGCAVLVFDRQTPVALLAVANHLGQRTFLARDLKNLQSLAEIIGVALTRAVMDRENTAHRIVEHEFDLAKQLQRQLLGHQQRKSTEHGYQVLTQCIPAFDMAGDHAEFLFNNQGELFFAIIDVMGKGVSAAILAGIFRSHFLAWTLAPEPPGDFLQKVSNSLERQLSGRVLFVTAFVGRIDVASGQLYFCGAGHPPLLLLNGSSTIRQIPSEGPPLGVVPDFLYLSESVQLEPGNCIVGITDGFYEWRDKSGAVFGWDALVQHLSALRTTQAEVLANSLLQLLQDQIHNSNHDDRTLLLINRCQP